MGRKKKAFPTTYKGCQIKPESWQYPPENYPAPECIKPVSDQFAKNISFYRSWKPHVPTEPPGPVTVSVRCNGSMHNIVYDKGHLSFPAHPQIKRNEALFELGARCRCIEVREGWRRDKENLLPVELLPVYRFVKQARKVYRARLAESLISPPTLSVADTIEYMKSEVVDQAAGVTLLADALDSFNEEARTQNFVVLCPYFTIPTYFPDQAEEELDMFSWDEKGARRPKQKERFWAPVVKRDGGVAFDESEAVALKRRSNRALTAVTGRNYNIRQIGSMARNMVASVISQESKLAQNWTTKIEKLIVGLKPSWLEKVFKKGLSVIEGHFVLDTMSPFDLHWYRSLSAERRACMPPEVAWWLPYGEIPEVAANETLVLTIKRVGARLMSWPAKVINEPNKRKILLYGETTADMATKAIRKARAELKVYEKMRKSK